MTLILSLFYTVDVAATTFAGDAQPTCYYSVTALGDISDQQWIPHLPSALCPSVGCSLSLSCGARARVSLDLTWCHQRPAGRPRTTWMHQISSDSGLSSTIWEWIDPHGVSSYNGQKTKQLMATMKVHFLSKVLAQKRLLNFSRQFFRRNCRAANRMAH